MTHLSELLKKLREEKDFSLLELSKKLKISRQCVHSMEKGLMRIPVRHMIKLSKVFCVSIDVWISAAQYDLEEEIRRALPYRPTSSS